MPLTERDCQRKPPGRYADGLNNLYFLVKKDGRRYWTFRFYRAGVAREKGLGRYPKVGRAEARQKAADCMKLLDAGIDPIDVSKSSQAPTFSVATEEYIAEHTPRWRDPKAPKTWRGSLTKHAYPRIENKAVDKITTQDVISILTPIWTKNHVTATKIRSRIELIINYAKVGHNLNIPENPAKWKGNLEHKLPLIPKARRVKNFRYLSYKEAPKFLKELRKREGDAARALEWCLVTAMRSGSVYKMRWSELDLDNKVWTSPPANMKGYVEMRVPLTQEMVEWLGDAKDPDQLVFRNHQKKQFSDAALLAVLKRMDYHNKTVVHGLRSTFSTWAHEKTMHQFDIIEAALSHKVGNKVSQAYNRGDLLQKRRRLMEDWCKYLQF